MFKRVSKSCLRQIRTFEWADCDIQSRLCLLHVTTTAFIRMEIMWWCSARTLPRIYTNWCEQMRQCNSLPQLWMRIRQWLWRVTRCPDFISNTKPLRKWNTRDAFQCGKAFVMLWSFKTFYALFLTRKPVMESRQVFGPVENNRDISATGRLQERSSGEHGHGHG